MNAEDHWIEPYSHRTFKVKLTRGRQAALYLLEYFENEHATSERIGGDSAAFVRKDGTEVAFQTVHMDKLANTVKEWAEECGAEGEIKEITGLTCSF